MLATQVQPALRVPKPGRSMRVLYSVRQSESVDLLGILITEGRKADGYHVRAEHDDMSVAVEFHHETDKGRSYSVSCNHTGRPHYCTCPARVRCRHMDAVAVLVERGLIRTDYAG